MDLSNFLGIMSSCGTHFLGNMTSGQISSEIWPGGGGIYCKGGDLL